MSNPQFPDPFGVREPLRPGAAASKSGLDVEGRVAALEQALGSYRTNTPTCRVTNSGTQATTSGADKTCLFDSEAFDVGGIHSTSSNTDRLTAPVAGVYRIFAFVEFPASATGDRIAAILLSGTTAIAGDSRRATSAGVTRCTTETDYKMAADDWVRLVINQTSGGALNATAIFGMTLVATG